MSDGKDTETLAAGGVAFVVGILIAILGCCALIFCAVRSVML